MRAKWVYVVGGLVAVLVLGLVAAGVRGGAEEPAPARKVQAQPTPRAPETYPTQGEYVPPRPAPRTRSPRPRVEPSEGRRPEPRERPERRFRGECPRKWAGVPFLREWCERNGFRTR